MNDAAAWFREAWARLQPSGELNLDAAVAVAVAVAIALLVVPALWRWSRVAVTVVHELGHAVVGVAARRRFTGLVLRPDMSGHTVTVGPARGFGLVASTWAGYPAPAVVGAVVARLATGGWAPTLLGFAALTLLLALVWARSLYTAGVLLALAAVTGTLWWWGPPQLQGAVVLATGCFLVAGAWRHLVAVAARPTPGSDPGTLARLTRVPRAAWVLSHGVVLGLATWWLAAGIVQLDVLRTVQPG